MPSTIVTGSLKNANLNTIGPIEWARRLISCGYAVFPCFGTDQYWKDIEQKKIDPGYRPLYKAPRLPGGVYENSLTNRDILNQFVLNTWNQIYPAICCWNVLSIDVDSSKNEQGETGIDSFKRIQRDLGLSLTPSVRTASGGEHYLFKIPRNFLFITCTKLIYQGVKLEIDVKGFGGYIIAPGTVSIDTKVNIGESGLYEPDPSILTPTRHIIQPGEQQDIPLELLALLATDRKRPYAEFLKKPSEQNPLKIQMLKMTGNLLRSMYPDATDEERGIADPSNYRECILSTSFSVPASTESVAETPDNPVQSDPDKTNSDVQGEHETLSESDSEASEGELEADIDEVNIYDGLCQTDDEFENRVLYYIHPNIRDAIKRMQTTLPLDSAAITYLTILGSQIRACIYHNKKWRKIVFHSMLVGRTGAGKDDLLENVTYALEKLQTSADKAYRQDVRDYKKKMKEYERQERAKAKKGEKQSSDEADGPNEEVKEPKEPMQEHYILSSSISVPGIFDRLTQMDESGQPGGLCICTGEGDQFIEDLQRFSNNGGDFSTLIPALDGKPIRTGYKHVRYCTADPKLGVCLAIQPETIEGHFSKRRKQVCQGFFSRFFYNIVPKQKHGKYNVDTDSEPINPPDETTYEEKLLEIVLGANQNRWLRFSTDDGAAKEVYQEHADMVTETYNDLIESDETIDVFISSLTTHSMDWVRNVAGIAHVLNQAALALEGRFEELSDVITGDEMRFAVAFFKHYRAQFLGFVRGMGSLDTSIREDAKKVMRRIVALCTRENKTEVSWSKVKDQFPTMLKGPKHREYAERMLKYLKSYVLVQAKEVKGANYKTSIMVSPTPAGRRLGSC